MVYTFDEVLSRHVGQFGPGQWRILSASSLCLIANAAAFFFWTFSTVNPIQHHDWDCVDPTNSACQAVKQQEVPNKQDFCSLPAGSIRWTNEDSLVAKFNLVCEDAWKVQFTNSLMFMGALVGSGLFGFLCDRWGRRKPLFLATGLIAVSMFASLGAPNYWVFAVLRMVTGLGAAGQSHCNFLLSTEPVGPAFRGVAGLCTNFFWVAGEFAMVALAYALVTWNHFLLACAAINTAFLFLYPLVPESGRWLLSQGRTEEAKQFLQRIAKANGSQVPNKPIASSRSSKQLAVQDVESGHGGSAHACTVTVTDGHKDADSNESSASSASSVSSADLEVSAVTVQPAAEPPVTLAQMLRRPRLAHRLLILLVNSFGLMLNYYGISMGAGGIPGSIYMTFAIGAAAEAVAMMVVAPSVDRLGRHNILSFGQLIGGAACIACANVRGGSTQAALAAIGKFGCSAASAVNSIYIAELLPTSCRSSVMGICSQASRVGSITAPFLLMMGAQVAIPGHTQVFIPFMGFGCLAILSGLLIMTMPETLGAAMPENVADLENLLSVFEAKPWRNGITSLIAFVFRTRARALSPVGQGRPSMDASSTTSSSGSSVCSVDAEAHVQVDVVTVTVNKQPPKDLHCDLSQGK